MTWREFYHWLTTSRYTRRLEQENQQLRADIDRLRADNDGLLRALYPALRAIRTEHETAKEQVEPIRRFKW